MTRIIPLLGTLVLVLCPVAARAEEPYFGFRFTKTRQGTFVVSYVDASGLAQQMGLKKGDVLNRINRTEPRTPDEVRKLFDSLSGGPYKIEIERSPDGQGPPVARAPLTGEIRRNEKSGKYYCVPKEK
ncbi:MAG: hypothetical protein HYS12_23180 [Planctomycetes bacterium]|nr:hypothetical protein [Planctomycetota bacterium]